jgi:hypothetical protein
MKKIKWILLIVLATIQIAGDAQVSNKDEMIKKIFSVLKNKDEEGYIKLFPDAATIKAFLTTLIKADTSGDMNAKITAYIDQITDSSLRVDLRKDFKKYIKKGEDKGVDWSHSVFVSYNADSIMVKQDGVEAPQLTGKIYFNNNNKEYFLKFKDIIWFENKGWYGVEINRVDEKSKENSIDEEDDADEEISKTIAADSTAIADSMIKMTNKKPVQKSKQPVKPKPVKPKTQPPAKKPE